jgi:hypothetical protein
MQGIKTCFHYILLLFQIVCYIVKSRTVSEKLITAQLIRKLLSYMETPKAFTVLITRRCGHGLWYPRSRVRTRPKPSDFSGEKIHSMPSFGGEVKPPVPCRRFAACKRTLRFTWKSESQAKLTGHFSPNSVLH